MTRSNDGTFLPCVRAAPSESNCFWVRPEGKEPYVQFDARALGHTARAYCIIHGDLVKAVVPSPYFIPQAIFDKLLATEYRGECHALRIRMKDDREFTMLGGLGMSCYQLPDGYSWGDIVESGSGFDHHPVHPIFPMIEFHCVLWGLPNAKIKEAEQVCPANLATLGG